MSYRCSVPVSKTSRNPSVVINPTFTPLRSSKRLATSVVPYVTCATSLISKPERSAVSPVPWIIPTSEVLRCGDGLADGERTRFGIVRNEIGERTTYIHAKPNFGHLIAAPPVEAVDLFGRDFRDKFVAQVLADQFQVAFFGVAVSTTTGGDQMDDFART